MIRALAALLLLGPRQEPKPIPEVEFEVAFPNVRFERATCIDCARDATDRLFILEQPGRVYWIENKGETKDKQLALDITAKVRSRGNEEGLLGLAFHPKFQSNGFVFLQYSASKEEPPKNRRNVLSRFTMNKERTQILPESEKVVLEVPQPYENHNGGCLQFGPEGYLYIGLGDGGAANDPHGNGQKLTTFLGKFLRIDINQQAAGKAYAVPPDNPFVGKAGILPEIWSYGWRNPWGYHFDRKTGELWSADVGQDKWEEIDIVKKGLNYGWNVREGKHPFQGNAPGPFEEPIVEHPHGPSNSVTGGCVYRGKKMPELDGVYLYGDFVTGNMWGLRWDGKKAVEDKLLFEFKMKQISTFGEDKAGEVYFATFTDGRLYRFKLKAR